MKPLSLMMCVWVCLIISTPYAYAQVGVDLDDSGTKAASSQTADVQTQHAIHAVINMPKPFHVLREIVKVPLKAVRVRKPSRRNSLKKK